MAEEATTKQRIIKPQPGYQEDFLKSNADIVIGGGAAGAGKTFALLIEPLRNISNSGFRCVMFRRTFPQIKNDGGLWDTSSFYSEIGGSPRESDLKWNFPSGASIKFSHLEYEKNVYDHQGAQYPLICFDELTHFTAKMFFYLLSRNRSVSGIKPYVRATCNPDPDSWVAKFIEWWIDEETGLPIPERCGKVRFFIMDNDVLVWGDSKEDVIEKVPHIISTLNLSDIDPNDLIKSVTFIPGTIYENRELLKVNPEYLSSLLAQDEATKAQLLEGNWKIRTDGYGLFEYNKVIDLFTNLLSQTSAKYITCDASRFGRDFTVIFTWMGWEVVNIKVFYKTEAFEIVNAIEEQRKKWTIPKSNVLVDQDGVGDGAVKLGGYVGFHGGANAIKVPETSSAEYYKNLKTQCYYRFSERVNSGEVALKVSNETVQVEGVLSHKIKVGKQVVSVIELIKQDLAAIKRANPDGEGKKQINTKEEQKNILGRSPDFGDGLMMREYFELKSPIRKIRSRVL